MGRRTLVALASLLGLLASGACAGRAAARTGPGSEVLVFAAALDAPPAVQRMPTGCRELARSDIRKWTEQEMTGSHDPFRKERIAAAQAGGNALVVLSRQTATRRCLDCPASSPITDCPMCEGAWFDVVFISYGCSAEGLAALHPRFPQGPEIR